MCGIVGAVAERAVAPLLLEGLKRLEYRGYDSAGIATCSDRNRLHRFRSAGAVSELADALESHRLPGGTGIAHTRWATHGTPSETNAHPHISAGNVALVHNGIIENAARLQRHLEADGYRFDSETDTEVITHLVHQSLQAHDELLPAVRAALERLHGQFAIAAMTLDQPDRIVAARKGCPLVIGSGRAENFVASDVAALLPFTRRLLHLEEGDIAEVSCRNVSIWDASGKPVTRSLETSSASADAVELHGYSHFMQKEIFEQPAALTSTIGNRLTSGGLSKQAFDENTRRLLSQARAVHLVACGTSHHAAMVARYLIEHFARIPCSAEQASEYRYRSPVVAPGTLLVSVSQSGETADTLAALRMAQKGDYIGTLAICNVGHSSMAREADALFLTAAGPEIGVASTKAFTTQMLALMFLAIGLASEQNRRQMDVPTLCLQLADIPELVEQTLALDGTIRSLAARIADCDHALFVARGIHFPIALEGALKLKEISYIHAEAYPAGELKHGPLALVDNGVPVVAIAPNDRLRDKMRSNIQEIAARRGDLIVLCDADSGYDQKDNLSVLQVPRHYGNLADPFLYTVPLQLLAYHVAVLRGTNVDKPRNLAKSVTVE